MPPSEGSPRMSTLRVMTFNVRQPDLDEGENSWEARRDLLVETILEQDPDLIGTQELFLLQAGYIVAKAPQYAWFGTGRFGTHEDKHVGIFYRKGRCRLSLCGDVWLSETPDVPGSSSWDIIRPRQLTWGAFQIGDVGLFLLNTHFPYRTVEQEARRQTALLIKERVAAIPAATPVIVTADANSLIDSEPYRLLASDLRDAWCTAARRIGPEGTLNGFGRHVNTGRRIDWILYRALWPVREVETVTCNRNGRYPSDHFPVVATFEIPVTSSDPGAIRNRRTQRSRS